MAHTLSLIDALEAHLKAQDSNVDYAFPLHRYFVQGFERTLCVKKRTELERWSHFSWTENTPFRKRSEPILVFFHVPQRWQVQWWQLCMCCAKATDVRCIILRRNSDYFSGINFVLVNKTVTGSLCSGRQICHFCYVLKPIRSHPTLITGETFPNNFPRVSEKQNRSQLHTCP